MGRKLVFLAVLVLELGGVFSFYISQADQQKEVYEIKEDVKSHTLTITNPKPKKPTLREIIYYHIIEKPYEQVIKNNNNNIYNGTEVVYNKPIKYSVENFNKSNIKNTEKDTTDIEGLIEIKNDRIKYMTGSKDIINNEYTIIIHDNNKVKNIIITEKPHMSESANISSENMADKKQRTDSNKVTIINDIIFNNKDTSETLRNDTKKSDSHTTKMLETVIAKDHRNSNHNTTIFKNHTDNKITSNNITSTQKIIIDSIKGANEHDASKDISHKSKNTSDIEHNNAKGSRIKELDVIKAVNISSIKNAAIFEQNTNNIDSTESKVSNSNKEIKYTDVNNTDTHKAESNEAEKSYTHFIEGNEIAKPNNVDSRKNMVSFEHPSSNKIALENIKSHINFTKSNYGITTDTNKYYNTAENTYEIRENNVTQIDNVKNYEDNVLKIDTKENISHSVNSHHNNIITEGNEIEKKDENYTTGKLEPILNNTITSSDTLEANASKNAINITNIKIVEQTLKGIMDKDVRHRTEETNTTHYNTDIKNLRYDIKNSNSDIETARKYNIDRHKKNDNILEHDNKYEIEIGSENITSAISTSTTFGKTTVKSVEHNKIHTFLTSVNKHRKSTPTHNITRNEKQIDNDNLEKGNKYDSKELFNTLVTENISIKPSETTKTDIPLTKERKEATEVTANIDETQASHVNTKIKIANKYDKKQKDDVIYKEFNDKTITVHKNISTKDAGNHNSTKTSSEVHISINSNATSHENEVLDKSNESQNRIHFINESFMISDTTNNIQNKKIEKDDDRNITKNMSNSKNLTIIKDVELNSKETKQKYFTNYSNTSNDKTFEKSYSIPTFVHAKTDSNNITGDDYTVENEAVIYVYNDYDNPYDGKEGVDFKARSFTNGHGNQYFYPYPEDQENDVLPNNDISIDTADKYDTDLEKNKNVEGNSLGTIVVLDNEELNLKENDEVERENIPDKTESESYEIDITKMKGIHADRDTNRTVALEENYKQSGNKQKKRIKRAVRTLMSVNEDIAPENMYKDVMDKISERVRRSLREEGDTYGMSLTGGRGVVWNDFNKKEGSFPVGDNSDKVKVIKDVNKELSRTITNEDIKENEFQETHDNDLAVETDGQDANSLEHHIEEFNVIKTNKGVYDDLMSVKIKANEWDYEKVDLEDKETEDINSKDNTIEKLNEIKTNDDEYNEQRSEVETSLEEFNIVKNSKEDYYGHKTHNENNPITLGQTYGMSLIGGRGKVWNDLSHHKSYQVGKTTSGQDSVTKFSKDDEIINTKTAAFQSFLRGAPSVSELKMEKSKVTKPNRLNSVPRLPLTENVTINTPTTEYLIARQITTTKKPKIMNPKIEKTEIEAPLTEKRFIEQSSELDNTYGISLSGNSGIVWNDFNGRRVLYHVNEDIDNTTSKSKLNKEDEDIDSKIAQFKKFLKEAATNEESNIEDSKIKDSFDNSLIVKPFTEEPVVIEPHTEEPHINEPVNDQPKTNRPIVIGPIADGTIITDEPSSDKSPIVIGPTSEIPISKEISTEATNTKNPIETIKTYGMSLTGDHGLVWNDLNGGRVSYHVGETAEDDEINKITDATTLKPSNHNDDNTNHLLNEIDKVLDEIDELLEEIAEETDKPKENSYKVELNEIIEIIKEVFANESVKLEEKLNLLSNLNDNKNKNDGNIEENKKENANRRVDIQELVNNEEFIGWLNDWSSSNTEHLMKKIKEYVKEEVGKQTEEYLATHNRTEPSVAHKENEEKEIVENKESTDEDLSKKRKDCDNKTDKKELPIQISATNVYGSSTGNSNVTNIFIFNVNKMPDLNNNTMKPFINATDSVFVYGNEEVEENTGAELEVFNDTTGKESTEKPDEENTIDETIKGNHSEAIEFEKDNIEEIVEDRDNSEKKENQSNENKNIENSTKSEAENIGDKDIAEVETPFNVDDNIISDSDQLTDKSKEAIESTVIDKGNNSDDNEINETDNTEANVHESTSDISEEANSNEINEKLPSKVDSVENTDVTENEDQLGETIYSSENTNSREISEMEGEDESNEKGANLEDSEHLPESEGDKTDDESNVEDEMAETNDKEEKASELLEENDTKTSSSEEDKEFDLSESEEEIE